MRFLRPGTPYDVSHPVSSAPLGCDGFSDCLLLDDLGRVRRTDQEFCRQTLVWDLPGVFLRIRLGSWVLQGDHRGEGPSSHPLGALHAPSTWPITVMLTLVTWLRCGRQASALQSSSLPHPPSTLSPLGGGHDARPTSREVGIRSHWCFFFLAT